jgi:hypothetical protein
LTLVDRLTRLASLLIDQQRAKVIVPPLRNSTGHWFGGGNLIEDGAGSLWLVGRYRNQGDSRTGLGAGERGLELAIFRSDDFGNSFQKVLSFSKSDLNVGSHEVLSIEGSALRLTQRGAELFVSTEKSGIGYPAGLESYLKPGTGVWTIDRIAADSIEQLAGATVAPALESSDPRFVHIKDPFLGRHRGQDCLLFCSHPFSWTSSNTGYATLSTEGLVDGEPRFDCFPRGFTWDVAMTRATSLLPLPVAGSRLGVQLVFYDGGECVRNLDEHESAVRRPRGYSCEELGGLAFVTGDDLDNIQRISINEPAFVSPNGSGCSRYVDVLATDRGYYATWQQSQSDGSQPLVMNFVSRKIADSLLSQ